MDIRSVHEAGHAIAAVRKRVNFSNVSIEPDLLPGTDGHIMVTLPRHDGTLKSIERLLVVLYAGASAAGKRVGQNRLKVHGYKTELSVLYPK